MGQLITADTSTGHTESDAGGGEDAAGPCEPAGQVGGELGILWGSELVGPEVLPAGVGQGGGEFGERDADA